MKQALHLSIAVIACCLVGCANQLQLGVNAYNRGAYDEAAGYWNAPAQNGDPYAAYNLGLLWEDGLGSTPKNEEEAAGWYLRSAQAGYVPAMVRLAKIQLQLGNSEPALSWLVFAARYGSTDAVTELISLGEPVPPADLLVAEQQAALVQAQAASEAAASFGYLIGCALAGGSCAPPPIDSSRQSVLSTRSDSEENEDTCTSDFSCGVGFQCVKGPLQTLGVCMQTVNEFGVQQFGVPDADSVGPNLDLGGQCTFDTECPIGFSCDSERKVCVTR